MTSPDTLVDALTRTLRIFRRLVHEESRAAGLTQAQYNAMRYMMLHGERRMSELACYLELTNSATTGLIVGLCDRGFAVRRADPEDGRAVLVDVTPVGAAAGEAIASRINETIGQSFEAMSVPERYMAVGGLEALAAALEA
ncbi:MAG: MarR family winged helix-turn-helix transcriptional regulator [Candidatus Sericytochromatia bacterium]